MKPLLKWPGGKRRVLPHLVKHTPQEYNTYYEPFFGGGALYFDLLPEKAVIADVNDELVNVYVQVKNNPEAIIQELEKDYWANVEENYLRIRALDRDEAYKDMPDLFKAARILYLNKTCFNGLYRVNSQGHFNAAFGKYANPLINNSTLIREMSEQFNRGTSIHLSDFKTILSNITDDSNFIYLDPPYIPLNKTAYFTSYSKGRFNDEDHVSLTQHAQELDEKGNFVLLSNSDTPRTRELYKDFHIVPIEVKRSISAKTSGRKGVGEVLALGKTLYNSLM